MTHQPTPLAGRWLSRVLIFSIVLYSLLLLALWNGGDKQVEQHHVQLFRSGVVHRFNATGSTNSSDQADVDAAAESNDRVSTSDGTLRTFQSSSTDVLHFTCLGWRQTGGCSPDGPREPENDGGCDKNIKAGASGYCLLRNDNTGEEVQAMRLNCSSLREQVRFNCRLATDFALVAPQIDKLIAEKKEENYSQVETVTEPKNGVLMVMYPKLMESVYATIRLLRSYGCQLPVELWYLESEMSANPAGDSRILQTLLQEYGPISLRGISDGNVDGFNSKVFALAHSELDQVLFLDADNSPVKDPTFLFSTPEFVSTGGIFWPDFWHPVNTIFNINAVSPIWELVGTPYVDMFEQESGQLLIDRRRSMVALEVAQFLALRKPDHFERLKLLHGDKDLFRLAWLKTNTSFHMIGTPAAAAGMVKSKQFCGMTMVQHDPQGEVLFLHHNGKKLIGGEDDKKTPVWTHLQSFVFPDHLASVNADAGERYTYMTTNYHVRIYGGGVFRGFDMCYGDNKMKSQHYRLTAWEDLPWHDLEDRLHIIAQNASALQQTTE